MISCTNKIKEIIKEFTKDNPETIQIVIEGISYGSVQRTKSIFDLAGLNYLVREKFIEKEGINLTIAPPSEIKKFATGKGNANKEMMVNMFSYIFPNLQLPKIDDICDAYFMANYASKLFERGEI